MNTVSQQNIDESVDNKVSSWSHLEFHKPKILEMCESASKDREQGMIAPKAYPEHSLFDANLKSIKNGSIEEQLKYLVVHGYTGECIYNQAGINK
jgi:hypothetical protein